MDICDAEELIQLFVGVGAVAVTGEHDAGDHQLLEDVALGANQRRRVRGVGSLPRLALMGDAVLPVLCDASPISCNASSYKIMSIKLKKRCD